MRQTGTVFAGCGRLFLKIDVLVENNNLAPRYCGVTLSNLIVQTSPDWLKNR